MSENSENIDQIISKMSLDDKLGQLFMANFNGEETSEQVIRAIKEFRLGSLQMSLLFKRFVRGGSHLPCGVSRNKPLLETAKWLHEIHEGAMNELGIPIFVGIDQEGGLEDSEIIRHNATLVPIQMGLGTSGRTEDAYQAAKISAKEAKAFGVNMFYGPAVDVMTNIHNPETGYRTFSDDTQIVSDLAAAYIKGCQEENVVAMAKHFCGRGAGLNDAHAELEVIDLDEDVLHAVHIKPFRDAIAAGVDSIMVAHTIFSSLQTKKEPASLSHEIVTELLREKMGFKGVVITDALSMFAISKNYGVAEACALSIEAGCDMFFMKVEDLRQDTLDALKRFIDEGRISEDQINESVRRILELKIKRGLFNLQPFNADEFLSLYGCEEHQKAVLGLSRRGTVLLKKGRSLPVDADDNDEILCVVPRIHPVVKANDKHVSHHMLKEKLEAFHSNIIEFLVDEIPTEYQKYELDVLAERAKCIVFGFAAKNTVPEQIELFKELSKKCPIIAVTSGSPSIVLNIPEADSIVMTFGLTPLNLQSAAEVIFGKAKETGTLPVTISDDYKIGNGYEPGDI